jgi:hypothetical protein
MQQLHGGVEDALRRLKRAAEDRYNSLGGKR